MIETQAKPDSLMRRYYEYGKTLIPKISDSKDQKTLRQIIQLMENIFENYALLHERAIFGDADSVIIEDLTAKISEWKKEIKKCTSLARRHKFVGYFKNFLVFPHSGDYLLEAAGEYESAAKNYTSAIKNIQKTLESVQERKKTSGKNNLVNRVLSGNIIEEEQRQFENYLREHYLDLCSYDRERYVQNPDQLLFDSILVLRDKYDPRGRF